MLGPDTEHTPSGTGWPSPATPTTPSTPPIEGARVSFTGFPLSEAALGAGALLPGRPAEEEETPASLPPRPRFPWLDKLSPQGRRRLITAGALSTLLLLGAAESVLVAMPHLNGADPTAAQLDTVQEQWPPDDARAVPALEVAATPTTVTAAAVTAAGQPTTSGLTVSGIPARVQQAYAMAAQSTATTDPACGLSWPILAGIGRVESNHGRHGGSSVQPDGRTVPAIIGIPLSGGSGTARITDSDGGRYDGDTVHDRAVGPMQFIPGTWRAYGADGDGDGARDPQDIDDAALAAAHYLCAGGGDLRTRDGQWAAVYRYNHSDSYVSLVLGLADDYATGRVAVLPDRPATVVTDPTVPAASTGAPPAVNDDLPAGSPPVQIGGGVVVRPVPPSTTPVPTTTATTAPPSTPTSTTKPHPTQTRPTHTAPAGTPTTEPTTEPPTTPAETPTTPAGTPTPTETPTATETPSATATE